jgi:hypothetical protein
MTDFHGLPTATLENEHLRLEYLTTAGPRIVGLSYHGSPNMLADLHDLTVDTPLGPYSLLGGHRLWTSPESLEKTYIPDQSGLQVTPNPNGVSLTGLSEPVAGVRKILQIELETDRPSVRLIHFIINENPDPITIAAWAISMFTLGGTVILPQPVGKADPDGFLPNRRLSLWPYTRLKDERIALRDDFILVHAQAALPPLKVGCLNTAGWLAYWREGILFRKSFDLHPGADYPDGGCNAETYCSDRFVEMESLGPLETLAPGMATQLTETWELYDGMEAAFLSKEIRELLKQGG